jgi:hypothetical protein
MTLIGFASSKAMSFGETGKSINSISTLIMMFFAVGFPIFTFIFLKKNKDKLNGKEFSL